MILGRRCNHEQLFFFAGDRERILPKHGFTVCMNRHWSIGMNLDLPASEYVHTFQMGMPAKQTDCHQK